MRTQRIFLLVLAMAAVAMSHARGQAAGDIYVNGERLSEETISALKQIHGIPPTVPIEPGRYWYDPMSGLWGVEGGPAMGQLLPELRVGGRLQADASNGRTGVYINGRQLHQLEVQYLQRLFGYVIPGRYWLTAQGVGGYEGGPAIFNLYAAAAATRGSGYGYTRRTLFGGLGSDGNCSYYLHPGGSSVMTGNC